MTEIEQAVLSASREGRTPSLIELGGENAVLLAPEIATSGFFGDVVDALVSDWTNLSDQKAVEDLIADGLKSNRDRLVISHAVEVLAASNLDFRPFVFALDALARDADAHAILRTEAAAGLMRFALCNRRWKSSAISALFAIEPEQDILAGEMFCRLAAIAFEHFSDGDVLELLTEYAEREPSSAQAAYELGLVEIGRALTLNSLSDIADGFDVAKAWLAKSLNANVERRDTKMYLLLVQILIPLAREQRSPSAELAGELREVALVRQMWDAPAPGQEWLLPPREAELEWIPVVDEIVRTSQHLAQASWLDASRVLDTVLRLYSFDRAVQPGSGSVANLVRPWIEAGFVRERGLLSHLDQWLDYAGSQQIDRTEALTLRSNINQLAAGPPPGK
jgi:hypothetical protein